MENKFYKLDLNFLQTGFLQTGFLQTGFIPSQWLKIVVHTYHCGKGVERDGSHGFSWVWNQFYREPVCRIHFVEKLYPV